MFKPITTMLLASAAALSACTPMRLSKLEQRPPTIQTTSTHSVAELTACIQGKLGDYSGSTNFVPSAHGGTLVFEFESHPLMSVQIEDSGSTRQVTVFGPYMINGPVKRHRLEAVQACV